MALRKADNQTREKQTNKKNPIKHSCSCGPTFQVCPDFSGALNGIPSFCCVNCITQLHVMCKFTEVALDLSMSLIKILKSRVPRQSPEGHHFLSVSTMTESLTTTLWLHPTSQLLLEQLAHTSNPCLSSSEIRMQCETLLKTLQKSSYDINQSYLGNHCSYSIMGGHQIGQKQLTLSRAVLTALEYLLVFYVSYHIF